jgi:replicative DNA helicase
LNVSDLIRQGKKATPPTIIGFLPSDAKVGELPISQYLTRPVAEAVTVTGADGYAEAIRYVALRRRLVTIGQDISDIGFHAQPEETGQELIGKAQDLLFSLDAGDDADGMMTAQSEVDRMMSGQERRRRPTVPLPLPQLREVMGEDLEAGNLYGMLSGSGEGKTSKVLQIMNHAARHGHPALLLSYDQLWDQCLLPNISASSTAA